MLLRIFIILFAACLTSITTINSAIIRVDSYGDTTFYGISDDPSQHQPHYHQQYVDYFQTQQATPIQQQAIYQQQQTQYDLFQQALSQQQVMEQQLMMMMGQMQQQQQQQQQQQAYQPQQQAYQPQQDLFQQQYYQPTYTYPIQQQQYQPQQQVQSIVASDQMCSSSGTAPPACPTTFSFQPSSLTTPYTYQEGLLASQAGFSLAWISQVDGKTVLEDPMKQVEEWKWKNGVKDEIDDHSSSASSSSAYSFPSTFDHIFDTESSSFTGSNSGWSDPAVIVKTDKMQCRGANQPGHYIFCSSPGEKVEIQLAVVNRGEKEWKSEDVKMRIHRYDEMVWVDPYVLPDEMEKEIDAGSAVGGNTATSDSKKSYYNSFHTQNAALESMTHALSSTSFLQLISHPSGSCVKPNATALYYTSLTAPSLPGLYSLRITPTSPCSRLAAPQHILVEVTCQDGVFCNGVERMMNGRCQSDSRFATMDAYGELVKNVCDDADECTVDLCDETLGKCSYQLINTSTACATSICGADRCTRSCPLHAECGSDGCGGSCGMCQTGFGCHVESRKCVSDTSHLVQGMTCLSPTTLNIFPTEELEKKWVEKPECFRHGTLSDTPPSSFEKGSHHQASEISRHTLHIKDITSGSDFLTPSCVSFGSETDYVWRFVIPENSVVNGSNPAVRNNTLLPMMMNLDPNSSGVLKKLGYIGMDVQVYGRYNPRIDTVVEVRGTPGAWSGMEGQPQQQQTLFSTLTTPDPLYSCLEDRRTLNGSTFHTNDGEEKQFILQQGGLEMMRQMSVGSAVGVVDDVNASSTSTAFNQLHPFTSCNDNNTPPGGLGSGLTVLLPPGTYYLIISSYPRFNIPAEVQALHDAAAAEPDQGVTDAQMREVEALVRFTSGYLSDCANLACGNDGGENECGGGCDTSAGEVCTQVGKCAQKNCTPQCGGRQCGSDGCGGSCGTCSLKSITSAQRAAVKNPLGLVFTDEDVYCIEEKDPALELIMTRPREMNSDGSSTMPSFTPAASSLPHSLGSSQCALMPNTCDGARPVCYGITPPSSSSSSPSSAATSQSPKLPGCPPNTFCANNCSCLPLNTPLPDLLVKFDALVSQISLSSYAFTNKSCSLVEKCIQRPGIRKLLRFSVAIINQGSADLILPLPKTQPDEFLYSPCHHHYHYHHFADYSLLSNGVVKQRGHKQAFCLEDSMQESIGKGIPCLAHHTCTQPGIQKGWSDYYGADLDCQWIDVTDLTPGKYLLRIEVNSGRQLLESTFENNVVTVEVTIPA